MLIYRVFITSPPVHKLAYEEGMIDTTVGGGIWRGFCIFLSIVLCLIFTGFSGMHLRMHFYQMSLNLTSIEYMQFAHMNATGSHLGVQPPMTHQYDHGTFEVCICFLFCIKL